MKNILIVILLIVICFYSINKYLKKYERYEKYENNNYILPKIIYGYWDNLEGNDLINAHINTWRKNIPNDWKIEIITKNNINEYVDNDFIEKFKEIPSYRFSDFLRMYLLYKNGGTWIDASTIIIDGNFLEKYYNEMIENKMDVTIYEYKRKSLPNHIYLENWFLMAPKNSKFIKDIYDEFEKSYNIGFLEYKKNYLIPNIKLENTIGYDENTYLMQHAIIHYLFYLNRKYNLNIKDAEESMFKLHEKFDWNSNKIINYIINNNNWNGIYSIKLIGTNRKSINQNNEEIFINKLNNL